jgi:ABC-type multidrug transport system, permease component
MTYALRSFEYWVYSYRRVWRGSVVTSIVGPVLYLTALGVGLGKLVNRGAGVGVPYLDYVAPGILAATAMQLATFESAYPVMAAIRWTRQYFAMLATPLRTRDVLLGHQLYVAARLAVAAAIYLVILAAFGVLHSPYAILAWPAAILLGLAHSAPVSAFSAWLERDEGMNGLFRFVVMPMFLFSGTFFPVSRLPHVAREIAYATPLWNGVDLMRHLTLGTASLWPSLAHVAYLALWVAGGLLLASRAYTRRLVT